MFEKLQHEIEKILSKKKFTEEAKNKLLQSILFVYNNYNIFFTTDNINKMGKDFIYWQFWKSFLKFFKHIKFSIIVWVCLTKGMAYCSERTMYSLDEGNILEELMTIHHEMTHLSEGERPFSLEH